MSKIEAVIGGKAKGIADQVAIDLALGCKNQCVGCYAKKSCQRGKHYDKVIDKELDKKVLARSLQLAKAKGFQLARVGKHCDPGDHLNSLNGVLDCCNTERFRCIVVSKSLTFNEETAILLRTGNHVLHMSLGPFSSIAPAEEERVDTANKYRDSGVKTAIRLTRDVTQMISSLDIDVAAAFKYIVTPMRYQSKSLMDFYSARARDFEFVSGYYRPKIINDTWKKYMINVCGEINNELFCCNCLENI